MFFAYVVSLFVMVTAVFVTLYFKSELERMFGEEKEVFAFHLCNIIIVTMASFITLIVMNNFILGKESNWLVQLFILFLIVLPVYLAGYVVYEKYKWLNRKYDHAANSNVLIINEKYLNGKKRPPLFKEYNALGKEEKERKPRTRRYPNH